MQIPLAGRPMHVSLFVQPSLFFQVSPDLSRCRLGGKILASASPKAALNLVDLCFAFLLGICFDLRS